MCLKNKVKTDFSKNYYGKIRFFVWSNPVFESKSEFLMYEIRFICLKISKLFVFYSILNLFFLIRFFLCFMSEICIRI